MARREAIRIAVKRGQVFRVRRGGGLPARHIQIDAVLTGATPRGDQPIARVFEVTRNGSRKGRKRIVTARAVDGSVAETRPNLASHWLIWDVSLRAWTMGAPFEPIEED